MIGKLPINMQKKYILSRVGAKDEAVITGAGVGEDAAVIRIANNLYLVTHTDPITETSSMAGRLAMQVSSNDLATKGIRPRWALVTILLPEGFGEVELDRLTADIDMAARSLGIAIVGGHTEETRGLMWPIISVAQMGVRKGKLPISIADSRPGDDIIMINEAGIEGTAILAFDHPKKIESLGIEVIAAAKKYLDDISIMQDALRAAKLGVISMHDPTEGGVIGALVEMAIRSGYTFQIERPLVPVRKETALICDLLEVDPLKLLGSGALICTSRKKDTQKILQAYGGRAAVIGTVKVGKASAIILRGPESTEYDEPPSDEITKLFS